MTDIDFVPAKRGFIAITQKISRGYSLIAGSFCTHRTIVGTVESVTREGKVKRVMPAGFGSAITPRDWQTITILDPAKLADPEGFLAECRDRQDVDPDKYRPFADLEDVRQTAIKYRNAMPAA